MVSTPELFTNNSPMSPSQYVNVEKPMERKFIHQFYEALDIKHNNFVLRVGAAKSKRKSIISGNNF